MPDFSIQLTKNESALTSILADHAERCDRLYLWRRMQWLLAWYYLNGYRRFSVFDPHTGRITPHYVDVDGTVKFQCQELLFAINQVASRIQSMDFSPVVIPQLSSLQGLRDKAVAQLTLSSLLTPNTLDPVIEDFAYTFTCLGFCGITGHVSQHPTVGLSTSLSIVHPRELYPFPAVGYDHTQTGGFMRQHWVPVSRLEALYGKRKVASKIDNMDWLDTMAGELWQSPGGDNPPLSSPQNSLTTRTVDTAPNSGPSDLAIARVRELWLTGPNDTVSRYILTSGKSVLVDHDLSDQHVYPSIGFSRFMNNGSWYGVGMFDLLYSQHKELEKLTSALYQNVSDLDRYGILVMPQGQMPQSQTLRDVGRGLRVMFWEPDPISEGFTPFPIQPWNTGDMPGKVAAFARESMKQVNPITDIIEEKGRIDSASGLNYLEEVANRALTAPTGGIARAFSTMYRGLHQQALAHITEGAQGIPITNLSLDLLGAVIDNKEGTVSFKDNPLPDITRLQYTIRSLSPKAVTARRAELLDLWEKGINQDPLGLQLTAFDEGIDLAMYTADTRAARDMGIRAILSLFGDGEEPGELILTPHTTKPAVVLRLLETVMVGPAFMFASPAVQNEFIKFRFTLQSWMGALLPQGIPSLDESATPTGRGGLVPPPGPRLAM